MGLNHGKSNWFDFQKFKGDLAPSSILSNSRSISCSMLTWSGLEDLLVKKSWSILILSANPAALNLRTFDAGWRSDKASGDRVPQKSLQFNVNVTFQWRNSPSVKIFDRAEGYGIQKSRDNILILESLETWLSIHQCYIENLGHLCHLLLHHPNQNGSIRYLIQSHRYPRGFEKNWCSRPYRCLIQTFFGVPTVLLWVHLYF